MRKILMLLLISAVLLLSACTADSDKGEVLFTFTDSLGRTVDIYSYEKTVVISGSLAEIWQLAGGDIYGVTDDAYDGHNLTLSDDVRNYGNVQNPSTESIIADGVDLVILSGTIANHVKLAGVFDSAGITAAYFDVTDFEDYLSVLKICTEITRRDDLYIKNGENIRAEVEAAIQSAEGHDAPSILLMRALSTEMKPKGSDTMTGQMLADLGCINIADSDASLLEELSLEAIVRADPDFVFITTIGDSAAGIAQYETELASNPAWQGLSAVKNGNVYILPQELYHYKPNDRWGEAYENLVEILYGKE
ncbi:MAG: ABC transporter substrate-binding protein [Oscillospiraceae bacterium]|nr:ABC transporter substrate-binding protein [Oscillospiraceae bacterium]